MKLLSKFISVFMILLLALTGINAVGASEEPNFNIDNCNEIEQCSSAIHVDINPEKTVDLIDIFYVQPASTRVVYLEQHNKFHFSGVEDAQILRDFEQAPEGYEKVIEFQDSYPVFDRDSRRVWKNGWRKEHVYSHRRTDTHNYVLYLKSANGETFDSMLRDEQIINAKPAEVMNDWIYAGKITDRVLNENEFDKHLYIRVIQPVEEPEEEEEEESDEEETEDSEETNEEDEEESDEEEEEETNDEDEEESSLLVGITNFSDPVENLNEPSEDEEDENQDNEDENTGNESNSGSSNSSGGGHGSHSYTRARPKHRVLVMAVASQGNLSCGDELMFSVYAKNAGRYRETDMTIEVLSPELGIYQGMDGLLALPGRTVVEDFIIPVTGIYETGEHTFIIRTGYNGVITDRVTETVFINACDKPAENIDVIFQPTQSKGNKWFWPIFTVLGSLIVAELVGFNAWKHLKNKKKKESWEQEIEQKANSFTEEDRLY